MHTSLWEDQAQIYAPLRGTGMSKEDSLPIKEGDNMEHYTLNHFLSATVKFADF